MRRKEIYQVVAMSRNRVIGKDNKLPWHFPSDLKSFKELTMGHTIVMGRRTFDSIGRVLPGRESIVLTRTKKVKSVGEPNDPVWFVSSIQEAFEEAAHNKKIFIIGGADVFNQTLDYCDGLYVTLIDADYEGDTYYPELPAKFIERRRERIQDSPKIERVYYENMEPKAWITENYI